MQFLPISHDVNTIAAMRFLVFATVMLSAFASSEASQLSVNVLDRSGDAASGLIVSVLSTDTSKRAAPLATAIMDQVDQRFDPFVLAVRTGTAVTFPNSDSIAHQVYSFSQSKRFELGLYRGRPHPPIVFDKPGIVVVGCNIHDKMIGYVYVTDAAEFGKTNKQGAWHVTLPPGEYRVNVWSPLLARDEAPLERTVALSDAQASHLELRLTRSLRPEPAHRADRNVRDY
jgi:plastocyanin